MSKTRKIVVSSLLVGCLSLVLIVQAASLVHSTHPGKIMILEYHKIDYPESRWTRTPENFRNDLQRFYEKGYRLIRMDDFLENRIRVEKGRTPLILTFDDSSPGQLRFLSDEKGGYRVDPACAVGILESFHTVHPDFGLAATFFVLPAADPPNRLFNQPEYAQEKLRYLVRKGFEIGNHTYWHATLSKMSPEGVRRQFALAVKTIQEAVPGYLPKALALPMGIYPKDTTLLLKGSYEGVSYQHLGVMMVAGGPAVPPGNSSFNPLRIPRIQAVESEMNYWLRYFDNHPEERYTGN
ncbi:MAG: polysaccharide deacetylase family protein [Nitrospirae bacterium]|nr:polysaccharide deacetylase family protein [Nitrospirota bacterium]